MQLAGNDHLRRGPKPEHT